MRPLVCLVAAVAALAVRAHAGGGLPVVSSDTASKTLSLRATRTGGARATHGPLPTSATTMRPCSRHHC